MLTLLDGHSLTPKIGLNPDTWAPAIQERDGSGSFTLGPDEPEVIVGEWILDGYTPQAGMVWRIRSIETDFNTGKRTVQTEHLITSLKDISLFGEVTPEDMGGGSTVSAATAAAYILSKQSDWMLGTFGYQMSAPFSFNGDSLFDALETITSAQEAACWTYSFASYPFTINIVPKSSSVACELREGRNLNTIRKSIDRSQMFTRIYPIGKDNLHISGDYVSKNENTYGRKDTVRTDGSIGDATLLRAWASDILDNHCEPLVTITVAGLELSAATGEDLDKLVVGTRCQIPLPEYGTTITERITKVQWRDKVAAPEDVTITLANNQQDVARIINQISKSAGKAGRAGAKQAEEDHAWIEDTTDHVMLIAEKTFGKDAQTGKVDWSRVSRLEVGQDGIWGEVKVTEDDIVTQRTRITQNETAITAEATARVAADIETSGRLDVEAGKVAMVVGTKTGGYYIKAAEIAVSINESTGEGEAKIDAQHVYIGNDKSTTVIAGKCELSDVTADYIDAKISTLGTLHGISASFSGNVTAAGAIIGSGIYVGSTAPYTDISDGIKEVQISGPTSNTYKLQYKKFSDSSWQDAGTFSRATTLSGTWSSGKLTVTASPQGETFARTLSAGTTSWSGNTATVPINATYGSSGQYSESTGKNIYVDASSIATSAGYAGRAAVTLLDPTWNAISGSLPSNRTVTVSTTGRTNSSGTTSNLSKSVALYLTQGSWSSGSMTVNMRVGSTSGTAYAATTISLTEHTNCKANVYELKINGNRGKVKIYYKDGSNYVAPFSDSYYWYRSSTAADPTTYYST